MKSNNFYSKISIFFGCSLLFLSQATGMEYEMAHAQQQEAAMARNKQRDLEKITVKNYIPNYIPTEQTHAQAQQITNRFISDALANIRARILTTNEALQVRLMKARNQLMDIQATTYSIADKVKSAATDASKQPSLKVIEEIYATACQEAEKAQQAYIQAKQIIQNNLILSSHLDPILDEIAALKQATLDAVAQINDIITKLKAKQASHAVTSVIKTLAPKPKTQAPIGAPIGMLSQDTQSQAPQQLK